MKRTPKLVMPLVLLMLTGCVPATRASANWSDFDEGTIAYNSNYVIPTMKYTEGGVDYDATCLVVMPDGTVSEGTSVALNQPGVYEFIYSVDINGEIHSKTEKITVEYPEVYVGNPNLSSIRYVSTNELNSHSTDFGGATLPGYFVNLADGDELSFTQTIPVSELTSTNMLAQVYVVPLKFGTVDFSKLIFKLTDTDDESNFVTLRYLSNTTETSHCLLHAKANTQAAFVGVEQSGIVRKDGEFGLWCGAPFDGSQANKANYAQTYDYVKMVFGFDNDTKEVFGSGYSCGKSLERVVDLDDTSYISDPWSGFTCDNVRLSIYAEGYNSQTANFIVCGVSFLTQTQMKTNHYIDNVKPNIIIDEKYDSLPNGAVNYSYSIPEAIAKDSISGACEVTTRVFYNYFAGENNRIQFPVINGQFTPTMAGPYSIEYKAHDAYGNEATEIRTVNVLNNLPQIEITLPDDKKTTAKLGELITLSNDILVANNSGDYTLTKSYSSATTGEVVIEGNEFRPLTNEQYTVIYKVEDSIGRTSTKEYTVDVSLNNIPVPEKTMTLPKYFISGYAYEVPSVKTYSWNNGLVSGEVSIKVTDKNGTKAYSAGEEYFPTVENNGDKVTIELYAGDDLLETRQIETIINYVDYNINLLNYFICDNFEKAWYDSQGTKSGVKFTKSIDETACVEFANKQLINNLNVELSSVTGARNGTNIVLEVSDSANDANVISCKVSLEGNKMYFEVNEQKTECVIDSFTKTDNRYQIKFDGTKFSVGSYSFDITKFDNGKPFTGFESRYGFIKLALNNSEAGSSMTINYLSGAGFDNTILGDYGSPAIVLPDDVGGSYEFGTTYKTTPIYSGDVLSPNIIFTMSVFQAKTNPSDPDTYVTDIEGNELKDVDPTKVYEFKLEKYGQYSFQLVAKEDERTQFEVNQNTISFYILCPDTAKPTITLTSKAQVKAKVNESIELPTFTVSDNRTAADDIIIQIVILGPSGVSMVLDSSYTHFKAIYEGTYKVSIHAIDKDGNFATISYNVSVSK